ASKRCRPCCLRQSSRLKKQRDGSNHRSASGRCKLSVSSCSASKCAVGGHKNACDLACRSFGDIWENDPANDPIAGNRSHNGLRDLVGKDVQDNRTCTCRLCPSYRLSLAPMRVIPCGRLERFITEEGALLCQHCT